MVRLGAVGLIGVLGPGCGRRHGGGRCARGRAWTGWQVALGLIEVLGPRLHAAWATKAG